MKHWNETKLIIRNLFQVTSEKNLSVYSKFIHCFLFFLSTSVKMLCWVIQQCIEQTQFSSNSLSSVSMTVIDIIVALWVLHGSSTDFFTHVSSEKWLPLLYSPQYITTFIQTYKVKLSANIQAYLILLYFALLHLLHFLQIEGSRFLSRK